MLSTEKRNKQEDIAKNKMLQVWENTDLLGEWFLGFAKCAKNLFAQ